MRHPRSATRRAALATLLALGAVCAGPPEPRRADDEGERLWPQPPELPLER